MTSKGLHILTVQRHKGKRWLNIVININELKQKKKGE